MIKLIMHKLRGNWQLKAVDGNGHVLATGGAYTPREAAQWLIRTINRHVSDIELAVLDLGLLTESEIDAIGDEAPPVEVK